ncbi:MAG: hypothetical protein C0631_11355 [Sedimenticola sp.]|nr:MAG: hypothetical protein C0631_11355 [Sedimenticola sp.]
MLRKSAGSESVSSFTVIELKNPISIRFGILSDFIRQHPRGMGKPEIKSFLSHLVFERKVSTPTQNPAFNALLFLYREEMELESNRPVITS